MTRREASLISSISQQREAFMRSLRAFDEASSEAVSRSGGGTVCVGNVAAVDDL